MTLAPLITGWLLQAAALPDTIVAKTMPAQHSWFDYTSGALQLVVLVLAVIALVGLVVVLIALKRGIDLLKTTVDKLYADTRPIVEKASKVAGDAHDMVQVVRRDIERVSQTAHDLGDQLLDVVDVTQRRVDDVNAVLDVVQGELEETVLSTTAALRGVRLGGRAIAGVLGSRRKKRSRRAVEDGEGAY
ncbi:MAG: hypothetical protein M3Y64_08095 [Gemmatimonadota bacterium]|nr:hypothetical protein [Gemmatimonadota bacterium]